MDISKIKPTAEMAYEYVIKWKRNEDGTEIPELTDKVKLEIEFYGDDEFVDYRDDNRRLSQKMRDVIARKVIGWDLTDNGAPVPCNDENKAKWLPLIIGCKDIDGEVIAWKLVDAIRSPETFLKN